MYLLSTLLGLRAIQKYCGLKFTIPIFNYNEWSTINIAELENKVQQLEMNADAGTTTASSGNFTRMNWRKYKCDDIETHH